MTKQQTYDSEKKRLDIHYASSFPEEVFEYADEVEILDLSFCNLSSLPDSLRKLTKLRIAFFANNEFEHIPEVIAACPSLEMVSFRAGKLHTIADHSFPKDIKGLILTDNKLTTLPATIGEYTKLKKIMLAGNNLQMLPESLLDCTDVELLRLPSNKLAAFPEWLLHLPKLGWYNDGRNPFQQNQALPVPKLREISWHDLKVAEQIGKSANNVVYKGQYNGKDVAVKIYGKGMTTDGLPIDDMTACLLAGVHDNIIGGIGRVIDAPDQRECLVMPLIDTQFTTLAKAPSFTTFTRDVYPKGLHFSLSFITNVLQDIAQAMMHCHSKGIMHGDLYAHNILTNKQGESLLGDFGAATLYTPHSAQGKLREQVDVAGFGYLVQELLSHSPEQESSVGKKLTELQRACLAPTVSARPLFEEIYEMIRSL